MLNNVVVRTWFRSELGSAGLTFRLDDLKENFQLK